MNVQPDTDRHSRLRAVATLPEFAGLQEVFDDLDAALEDLAEAKAHPACPWCRGSGDDPYLDHTEDGLYGPVERPDCCRMCQGERWATHDQIIAFVDNWTRPLVDGNNPYDRALALMVKTGGKCGATIQANSSEMGVAAGCDDETRFFCQYPIGVEHVLHTFAPSTNEFTFKWIKGEPTFSASPWAADPQAAALVAELRELPR